MTRAKTPGIKKPRGEGKPFERGYDPRRNLKGQGPNPMTAALKALISEGDDLGVDDLKEIWRTGIARAKAGDLGWATLMAAYLDGKPVARQEQGVPGDFLGPDLSEFSSEELRAFIRAVDKDEEQGEHDGGT